VAFLNDYYREKGVTLMPGESVVGMQKSGATQTVTTKSGKTLTVDAVIAGIGILPETGLAQALGLDVDNGILVDALLRTSDSDIYAAGDVANVYSPALDMRRRVEHEDNANTMGRAAGRNMAGSAEPYEHLPYFYSDLFDLGLRGGGRARQRHGCRRGLGRAVPQGRHLLPSQRPGAWGAAVERLGSARRGAGTDRST
jgi:3-phenylpropionate/trans-cinnamate dioxygenase ferredoxin reductase subunit